jgi:DNA (cytosine-5)-methyltransferase 1
MHRDLSEWVHPEYHRWITVREAARLQSFHDGFVFKTSEWQMLKQVGNAVPPLLARALAAGALAALNEISQGAQVIPLKSVDERMADHDEASIAAIG